MSLVKYDIEAVPFAGKQDGFCFQNSSKSNSVKINPRKRINFSNEQLNIQRITGTLVQLWRTLPSAVQDGWRAFAFTFPQPTRNNPLSSLLAFNLFCKRNFFKTLSDSSLNDLILIPVLIEYPADNIYVSAQCNSVSLTLNCSFDVGDANQDVLIFISDRQSAGRGYWATRYRYFTTVRNSTQTVDITEHFIRHFGHLPVIGDKLFFSVVFAGKDNGQFTFHKTTAIVTVPVVPPFWNAVYGGLYNAKAVLDSRGFAPPGFRVASYSDWIALQNFCGGSSIAGGILKELGLVHWRSPNLGASDSFNFKGVGSGYRRQTDGNFIGLYDDLICWSSTPYNSSLTRYFQLNFNSTSILTGAIDNRRGLPVRLIASSGSPSSLSGTDGKIYPVIQIGSQFWCQFNSCETKFADGSDIPYVADPLVWLANAGSYRCAYNNDLTLPPF